MKIGIIQTAPLTADFSNNVRKIVQGYRDCMDHGFDLVVAPAHALCGAGVKDLADRTSFLEQTQTALEYLSKEINGAPLLLASYVPMPNFMAYEDEDEFEDDELMGAVPQQGLLVPYLVESHSVTELEEAATVEINGVNVYVDLNDMEVYIDDEDPDVIVHLPTRSWDSQAAAVNEERRQWEAKTNGVPVVCVQHVSTCEGIIYAGGSAVYSADGHTHTRLNFFEADNAVADLDAVPTARALPKPEELLNSALVKGIRDTVLNNKYEGACISLDNANSLLLSLLCVEALGAANVHGFTFSEPSPSIRSLGINIHTMSLQGTAQNLASGLEGVEAPILEERIKNAITISYADSHALMPMTSITRNELMMGNFVLYGDTSGYLAPLGNLYQMDVHTLCRLYQEKIANVFDTLSEPSAPEIDRIIHELADRNISAGSLIRDYMCPFDENSIRMVQRRIVSSAFRRTQTPMILHVDKEEERNDLPSHHRLND